MKTIFAIISSFLLLNTSFGQIEETTNQAKFKISFYGTSEYTGSKMINGKNSGVPDSLYVKLNNNTMANFGYTVGTSFIYVLGKSTELNMGLSFSQWSFKYRDDQHWEGVPDFNYTQHQYFFEIPVKFSYSIGHKNIKFINSAGISYSLLSYYKVKYSDELASFYAIPSTENNSIKTHNPLKSCLSASISTGMEYAVLPSLFIRLEPQFKYLIQLSDAKNSRLSLFSFGLNCSIVKSL